MAGGRQPQNSPFICLQPRQVSCGLTIAGGSKAALSSFIKEGREAACGLGAASKELQLQSLATCFTAGKESLASREGKGARDHRMFPQQTWAGETGSLGHRRKDLNSSCALMKTKRRGGGHDQFKEGCRVPNTAYKRTTVETQNHKYVSSISQKCVSAFYILSPA